jgi:hypothetical protein
MGRIILRSLVGMSVLAMVIGCGSYYKVTDPTSKNIYYTDDIEQMDGGAVKFMDAKTGSNVTLRFSLLR